MKKIILLAVLSLFIFGTNRIPVSCRPIDAKPAVGISEDLVGIYKMNEDTNDHDYFVVEKETEQTYSITYMNKGGDNRGYEHFSAYLSIVNNIVFLNIPDPLNYHTYFLARILSSGTNGFDVELALVADRQLSKLKKSDDVRSYIIQNLDDPDFYTPSFHFRKKLPLLICR